MKALTLRQPWASLVTLGVKMIETRSWSTSYRGPLAIHAGRGLVVPKATKFCLGEYETERDAAGLLLRGPIAWPYRLPLGAVVATCTLVDCLPIVEPLDDGIPGLSFPDGLDPTPWLHGRCDLSAEWPFGDFTPGRWAWLLADVERLPEPVLARGRQGLWTWQEAA